MGRLATESILTLHLGLDLLTSGIALGVPVILASSLRRMLLHGPAALAFFGDFSSFQSSLHWSVAQEFWLKNREVLELVFGF